MIHIFKKKDNIKVSEGKKVIHADYRRKLVIGLWVLFILGFAFAVFKNFTAIDRHTVHEKEVVKQEIIDTNRVETFVSDFAKVYYAWGGGVSLDSRETALSSYLTDDLLSYGVDSVPSQISTVSAVQAVKVWEVSPLSENEYMVLYSVTQSITEGEESRTAQSAYTVAVHRDDSGNLVIVKSPTLSPLPGKSEYSPERLLNDGSIDSRSVNEIEDFLNTFFRVYPTANQKELAYYVKNRALHPLQRAEYIFSDIPQVIYRTVDEQVVVDATVHFIDENTKLSQYAQYTLVMEKDENWYIIGCM